jgi:hypothetical protein
MSANSFTTSSRPHGRNAGAYLVALFATVLLLIAASYTARVTVLASIAPRFTGNASFDQKLLFIKRQNFGDTPLSIVAGSSMALNNLDADELEKSEGIRYLNAGAWGLSLAQTAEFMSVLESRFKVKELTLSVQFFELADGRPMTHLISGEDFRGYLSDYNRITQATLGDTVDAWTTKLEWSTTYGNPHKYTYLGFTETGSVLLYIRKREIDPTRWHPREEYSTSCRQCIAPLTNACTSARLHNTPFFVILPPLTHYIRAVRPDVRELYEDRRQRLAAAVTDCGGRLFDADLYADFEDSCFADFSHLNAEGNRRMTQLFLQWKHGTLRLPTKRDLIACPIFNEQLRVDAMVEN